MGFISCAGTNFILRASAFHEAGYFPTHTLTEDYALGMELKRKGYKEVRKSSFQGGRGVL